MFCLQSFRDLEAIDHLCINPIRVSSRRVHKINVLLNSCKQNITSLSLLVGTKVQWIGLIVAAYVHMFTCVSSHSGGAFDFSCQQIIFVNSLDPEQDRQNVGPDLDPNRLIL